MNLKGVGNVFLKLNTYVQLSTNFRRIFLILKNPFKTVPWVK